MDNNKVVATVLWHRNEAKVEGKQQHELMGKSRRKKLANVNNVSSVAFGENW